MKCPFALLQLFLIFQYVMNRNEIQSEISQLQTGISQGALLRSTPAIFLPPLVSQPSAGNPQQIISLIADPIETLWENWAAWSNRGVHFAKMQTDGNFVVYSAQTKNGAGQDNAIWASNTVGLGYAPRRVVLQVDGNLVLYDTYNNVYWSSGTSGQGVAPYRMTMQDDGNFVLQDSNNKVLWASGTPENSNPNHY